MPGKNSTFPLPMPCCARAPNTAPPSAGLISTRYPKKITIERVLLGAAGDADAANHIAGKNLVGSTTLDEAICLMAGAKFVVSNDSGLMHVAAALGRPQVALFGSSSPRAHAAAIGRGARAVSASRMQPVLPAPLPVGAFSLYEGAFRRPGSLETAGPVSNKIFPTAQDAENAFYEALERSDLEGMMAVWAEDDDIVCVHPAGTRLTGQDQVRAAGRSCSPAARTRACR